MIIKMIKKIKKLTISIPCLLLLFLAVPACGNEWLPEIEINNFKKLTLNPETEVSFLTDKIGKFVSITTTNHGLVLYELLDFRDTKLTICYLKKDLMTKPVLDMNRLFLEVRLDF